MTLPRPLACATLASLVLGGCHEPREPLDPRVKGLVRALAAPSPEARRQAANALAAFGPAAREAVASLSAALGDPDAEVRVHAARALGGVGPGASAAAPALAAALQRGDSRLSWNAALALGRIGPAARPAVPTLARLLESPDATARANATRALGGIGGAAVVPALGRALRDPDAGVRSLAGFALERLAATEVDAAGAVFAALKERDAAIHAVALDTLWRMGSAARQTPPEVSALLAQDATSADPRTRARAMRAFGKMGDADALTILEAGLQDVDAGVRLSAVRGLDDMRTADALPALAIALRDADPAVRSLAAEALVRQAPHEEGALDLLLQALKDPVSGTRLVATEALRGGARPWGTRAVGGDAVVARAAVAVATLLTAPRPDPDPEVRCAAATTLGLFVPEPPALPGLAAALRDADPRVRRAAATALAIVKPDLFDDARLPLLLEALHDDDEQVASAALEAVDRLRGGPVGEPDRPQMVAALGTALADRRERVRLRAAQVLARMGPRAHAALPALERALAACIAQPSNVDAEERQLRWTIRAIEGSTTRPGVAGSSR